MSSVLPCLVETLQCCSSKCVVKLGTSLENDGRHFLFQYRRPSVLQYASLLISGAWVRLCA
jgi:hypothetical protein